MDAVQRVTQNELDARAVESALLSALISAQRSDLTTVDDIVRVHARAGAERRAIESRAAVTGGVAAV